MERFQAVQNIQLHMVQGGNISVWYEASKPSSRLFSSNGQLNTVPHVMQVADVIGLRSFTLFCVENVGRLKLV